MKVNFYSKIPHVSAQKLSSFLFVSNFFTKLVCTALKLCKMLIKLLFIYYYSLEEKTLLIFEPIIRLFFIKKKTRMLVSHKDDANKSV